MLELIVCGAIGQLARSIIGIKKAMSSNETINWQYWGITMVMGAAIGAIAGYIVSMVYPGATCLIALTSGYAGTDFLEGLIKSG